jgi:hypothetical protein
LLYFSSKTVYVMKKRRISKDWAEEELQTAAKTVKAAG